MGYIRNEIIGWAKWDMNYEDYYEPTKEELDSYFKTTGASQYGYSKKIQWCGIWACYILRRAGLNVRWLSAKGIQNVTGKQVTLVSGGQGLRPGDVAVVNNGYVHHFIIEDVIEEYDMIISRDGNQSTQVPCMKKRYDHSLSGIWYYYHIEE